MFRFSLLIATFSILSLFLTDVYCLEKAPAKLRAALFIKLLGFTKNLSGEVSLYVIDDNEFAEEMKKGIGKKIGKSTLQKVDSGPGLPESKYSIIYCGSKNMLASAKKYAKDNQAISISGIPSSDKNNTSLTVAIDNGKPKIFLNIISSKDESLNWNPAIFKIASIIK